MSDSTNDSNAAGSNPRKTVALMLRAAYYIFLVSGTLVPSLLHRFGFWKQPRAGSLHCSKESLEAS